jgi:hypothetical protein
MLIGAVLGAGLIGLALLAEKGYWLPLFVALILALTWGANRYPEEQK